MTKDELIEALKDCEEADDTEQAHVKADQLLLAYINDSSVTEAFEAIYKWYS